MQDYWSGLLFLSPGDIPDPGIKPTSSVVAGRFFTTELPASAQFSSVDQSYLILCNPMDCSMPGLPIQHQFKLMSIELVMPSNHLILWRPLFLLPSIFLSIRVFSNESVLCIRWPNIRVPASASGSSNEYSGLISFRMNWLYLLAVQGTLKSLLQPHSPKASILQCSTFLIVQLYILTWLLGKL